MEFEVGSGLEVRLVEGVDGGVEIGVGVFVICGHGANSQLGPVRPTEEPSGQILASKVQPFWGGLKFDLTRKYPPKIPERIIINPPIININLGIDLGVFGVNGCGVGCTGIFGVG